MKDAINQELSKLKSDEDKEAKMFKKKKEQTQVNKPNEQDWKSSQALMD